MPDAREALPLKEVADRLSVNEKTARRYIDTGRLEAYRLPGGQYRVFADSLEKLIAGES